MKPVRLTIHATGDLTYVEATAGRSVTYHMDRAPPYDLRMLREMFEPERADAFDFCQRWQYHPPEIDGGDLVPRFRRACDELRPFILKLADVERSVEAGKRPVEFTDAEQVAITAHMGRQVFKEPRGQRGYRQVWKPGTASAAPWFLIYQHYQYLITRTSKAADGETWRLGLHRCTHCNVPIAGRANRRYCEPCRQQVRNEAATRSKAKRRT